MQDPDSSSPSQAGKRPEGYLISGPPATPSLGAILHDRITRGGPMGFAEFMATALYEPSQGYYAREPRQVGRGGDFFTSVSVGPLFGELLARRFIREWEEMGSPAAWRIIEGGAHDGTLAADVLGTIERLNPAAFSSVQYAIPEPLPRLQEAQRKTLTAFSNKVAFISDLDELTKTPTPGIAFGNELLDALPFHVIEWRSGTWWECRVALDASQEFSWVLTEITDPSLQHAVRPLGTDFPDGYRTEIRNNFESFLLPLTRSLTTGLLIWLDYGFARPEYYHPDRSEGTLRTFSKHRAADNPLTSPGEIDITAHVDFTAVAEVALSLGCQPGTFQNQGSWLTGIAREWLLSLEGRIQPDLLRQFQTLTHPAHLGGSFHVIELDWNKPGKSSDPTNLHRLALQACPSAGSA